MKFTQLLEQLGSATGLDGVALDSSGNCTLRFDDAHNITFTQDTEDASILLHAEVGEAKALTKDDCLELLRASLLGAQTGGGTLSVHQELGTIVLWKRHDDAFEDYGALEKAINSFLAQAIHWKKQLEAGNSQAQSTSPAKGDDQKAFKVDPAQAMGMRI